MANKQEMMPKIGYLTEPIVPYTKAVRAAKTVRELKAAIMPYLSIASDAYKATDRIHDWDEWRKFANHWSKRKDCPLALVEKYGVLLAPEIMVRVEGIAAHFVVPWGCAYIRCRDEGVIVEKEGIAHWVTPKPKPAPLDSKKMK